jgi:hypothetical protein
VPVCVHVHVEVERVLRGGGEGEKMELEGK